MNGMCGHGAQLFLHVTFPKTAGGLIFIKNVYTVKTLPVKRQFVLLILQRTISNCPFITALAFKSLGGVA